MTQPTLQTERLTLTPLSDDHLEHEVVLHADPEVLRYLSSKPRTREEVERAHAFRTEQGREVDGLGVWAGFLRAEPDRFVGIWMLQPPHGPSQPRSPGRPTSATGYGVSSGVRVLPRRAPAS